MIQTFLSRYSENFVARSITLLVFLTHALLLFFLYFYSFTSKADTRSKQKIVIETVDLKSTEINDQKIKQTAPTLKQTASPLINKTAPKATPVAASKSPTKPAGAKTNQNKPNIHKQKLLAQAKESLQKVISNNSKQAETSNITSSSSLKEIGLLQSENLSITKSYSNKSREENYQNEIINRLKSQLELHEYGNVDIELTLDRNGKCLQLTILREENRANRLYIEQTIPHLRFPGFGTSFPGESQHTFTIRISNLL